MSVRVVVDDQVYTLYIVLSGHGQIALDDYRHDSAVFGHSRHVEIDVAPADRAVARDLSQDSRDFFVRDLRVLRPSAVLGRSQKPLRAGQGTGGQKPCGSESAGPKKGSSGGLVRVGHSAEMSVEAWVR